eukprot:10133493-Karenia_brevis.AAC.1
MCIRDSTRKRLAETTQHMMLAILKARSEAWHGQPDGQEAPDIETCSDDVVSVSSTDVLEVISISSTSSEE